MGVHRNGDSRSCGATTIVSGQSSIFANGILVSVTGDPNTHGGGALTGTTSVTAEGITVVQNGDPAAADDLCIPLGGNHCAPNASSASSNVFAS